MADVFTKEKRSEIMSQIKSVSQLEIRFRKLLSQKIYPLGYRYKINYKKMPGKPDVAFVSKKIAVFIDGDFWHGRSFSKNYDKLPKKYWREKIKGNMLRDKKNAKALRSAGWAMIRVWESDFKKNPEKSIQKIIDRLF